MMICSFELKDAYYKAMNTDYMHKIEEKFFQKSRDKFNPGDTVAVHSKIQEGDKTRTQVFEGVVLGVKGSGTSKTFTVRKISYEIGVEKIFPFHSPLIEKVELIKKGKARRAKLFYLREKVGNKALQVKQGGEIMDSDLAIEEVVEEKVDDKSEVKDAKTEKAEEPKKEKKTEDVKPKEEKKSEAKPAEKEKTEEKK